MAITLVKGTPTVYLLKDGAMTADLTSEHYAKPYSEVIGVEFDIVSVDAEGELYIQVFNDPEDVRAVSVPIMVDGDELDSITVTSGLTDDYFVEITTAAGFIRCFYDHTSGSNAGNLLSMNVHPIKRKD